MDFEEPSEPGVLVVEAIGLAITGLLLLTIACALQLAVRFLTQGALVPPLGVLAYGFLFYVCATFLVFGTHRDPAHPASLIAPLSLQAVFLCAGWLLWRSHIPATWLLRGLAFVLLVQGGSYGFARLRQTQIDRLMEQRAAFEDAFVPRFFVVRPFVYIALPAGATLGILLASLAGAPASRLAGHAAAGVFALLGMRALSALSSGFQALAGELVATHEQARVTLRVVSSSSADRFRVFAPEPSPAHVAPAMSAATIAADLRRVLVIGQLEHALFLALSCFVVAALELPALRFAQLAPGVLNGALVVVLLPYWLGQRRTNQRLLLRLSQPTRAEVAERLRAVAPTLPSASSWAGLLACLSLSAGAYACIRPLLLALMP